QVLRKRIHQAVESLVRHRLPLEASSRQNDDLLSAAERLEKPADERGLAHARTAVHGDRHRTPLLCRAKRLPQEIQLRLPSDEWSDPGLRRTHRSQIGRRRQVQSQTKQDLPSSRAILGAAAQELAAETVKIFRSSRRELPGWRRFSNLLLPHYLNGLSTERTLAGQCLVEHDAQAVPVARLRDRKSRALLRRHIGGAPRPRAAPPI